MRQTDKMNEAGSLPVMVRGTGKWRGALKALAIVAVVAALGWQIRRLYLDWSAQGGSLSGLQVRPVWLVASAAACVAAQFSFGAFWRVLLRAIGVDPSWPNLYRSYCIGTLGKYVPGKAMVVVMRTTMIRRGTVGRFPVALSVFFETTAEMLVGCMVACVCLLVVARDARLFWGSAGATAIVVALVLWPPMFTLAARFASLPFSVCPIQPKVVDDWFRSLRRLPIFFSLTGWLLFGASFWAVMMALGAPCAALSDFAFLTGATAMAVVGGFVFVFLPSGIGIRELIIIHLLAPRYGPPQAVLASLMLRTVWTVAETLPAGVLYWRRSDSRRSATLAHSDENTQSVIV